MVARRRAVVAKGALLVVALGMALPLAEDAAANDQAQASDPDRARLITSVTGELNCEAVGHPNTVQLVGSDNGKGSAEDALVRGTVTLREPSGPPRELNVEITDAGREAGVEIQAVVVKGGPGANVYERRDVLPPDPPGLDPPQNYIPPLNESGRQPDISKWFLCYTIALQPADPDLGTLRVVKKVDGPAGVPTDPLPTRYTVGVRCVLDGEVVRQRRFTFREGGGVGTTGTGAREMTVPMGARCRVRELNTAALPAGCEVHYNPPWARRPGVTIRDDIRVVTVRNDCQNVDVQTGSLEIVKRIEGFAPGELPDSFVFDVECSDGTDERVTVPATGEPGRVGGIEVDEYCLVTERTGSLPPGLEVTYTINGSPSPVPGAAEFQIVENGQLVTVTVTNARSTSPPEPPPPEVPGEPPPLLDPDKTVQPGFVRAGGLVRYSIEVRNYGLGVGRRVLVCDRLPAAMTLVSAPGSRFRNGRICWRIARLGPLASREFTLLARVNARASGPTTNVATADAPRTRTRTGRVRVLIRARRGPSPGPVTG